MLHLSDLHGGKETSSFNSQVLTKRLDTVLERSVKIASIIKAGYRLRRLYIANTGDNVDNDSIYKTHPHHVEKRLSYGRAQVNFMADLLKPFLLNCREIADEVVFQGVRANHGRVTSYTHESNNWDLMLYDKLKDRLCEQKGITIDYGESFAHLFDVEGHGVLLYHGAGIKSYQSIPFYGIRQRVMRWKLSMPPFRIVLLGHFHQVLEDNISDTICLMSGTAVSDDDFALENYGNDGVRRFQFFGMHRDHPMTWRFEVEMP